MTAALCAAYSQLCPWARAWSELSAVLRTPRDCAAYLAAPMPEHAMSCGLMSGPPLCLATGFISGLDNVTTPHVRIAIGTGPAACPCMVSYAARCWREWRSPHPSSSAPEQAARHIKILEQKSCCMLMYSALIRRKGLVP